MFAHKNSNIKPTQASAASAPQTAAAAAPAADTKTIAAIPAGHKSTSKIYKSPTLYLIDQFTFINTVNNRIYPKVVNDEKERDKLAGLHFNGTIGRFFTTSNGICFGASLTWLYMRWKREQFKFFQILRLIMTAPDDVLEEYQNAIKLMLAMIEFAQYPSKYLHTKQVNIYQIMRWFPYIEASSSPLDYITKLASLDQETQEKFFRQHDAPYAVHNICFKISIDHEECANHFGGGMSQEQDMFILTNNINHAMAVYRENSTYETLDVNIAINRTLGFARASQVVDYARHRLFTAIKIPINCDSTYVIDRIYIKPK